MAQNFLSIARNNKTDTISFTHVLRHDLLWWLIGAGVSTLLFTGVLAITASARPDIDTMDVGSILSTTGRPFYYALIVGGVLLARRSFSVWTWALVGILVFGFMSPSSFSFSAVWMPHSILYTMVAMTGLLAVGRVVEYLYMRYIIRLGEPHLSVGGWTAYLAFIVGAILLDSSTFYSLIQG